MKFRPHLAFSVLLISSVAYSIPSDKSSFRNDPRISELVQANRRFEEIISELDYHLNEIQPPLNHRPTMMSEERRADEAEVAKYHKREVMRQLQKLSRMAPKMVEFTDIHSADFLRIVQTNLDFVLPENPMGGVLIRPWYANDSKDASMAEIRNVITDVLLRLHKKICTQRLQ